MHRCSAESSCHSARRGGLFRHYWVVLKLGITVFATVILLIYMGTFRQMAGVAADPVMDLAAVRNASPIVHAILALILLFAATVLGVYKPFGMTDYGKRKLDERRFASATSFANTVTGGSPGRWRYPGLDLRRWRSRDRSRAAGHHPAPDRPESDAPLACVAHMDRATCNPFHGQGRRLMIGAGLTASPPSSILGMW